MALAAECAPWVAPQTMAAIVRTESQFRPYAIGINGGHRLTRQPANKEEAVATAKWLIANHYNIDMGLGQVNSNNLVKTGLSVDDAFDPCRNLAAAGLILTWNYQSASRRHKDDQSALHAAISAYNTGSFTRGFSNGYVQKVVNNAHVVPAISGNAVIPLSVNTRGVIPLKPGNTNKAAKKTSMAKPKVSKQKPMSQPVPASASVFSQVENHDRGIMVYAD